MREEPQVNILLVDDQPENLLALEAILADTGATLVQATSGEKALRYLLQQDFAVILLDVQMPSMDGFEVASLIRSRQRSRQTPIIFLTAFGSSEQFMARGYALGAVDYLLKPIAAEILKSKVAVFIELFKKTEALQQKTAQLEAINAEMQMSEERFRSLSTYSPVGVFVTDTAGRCVYTNPRFQGFYQLTQPDTAAAQLCENWLALVSSSDRTQANHQWVSYLEQGGEYSQELQLALATGGEAWVHVRVAPMLSDQGALLGHVGTIEDITERRQAEIAQAQVIRAQAARHEAEAANRMKDEFIAILSHELRTPLNAILGWAHLINSRRCDEKTITHALEIIERNAQTQARLIDDILDVSQIVRGKLQLEMHAVDLAAVARMAVETVQAQAQAKAIALVTQITSDQSLRIMGDPTRLQQVVWNLLSNAIKFTPAEGRIELTLSVVEAARVEGPKRAAASDLTPALSSVAAGDPNPDGATAPSLEALLEGATGSAIAGTCTGQRWAQIQISDTGMGIDPDFLPYIFERFRQADSTTTRNHGGLGLGLAIVRYLVEYHQGCIFAASPGRDQGATFSVRLPLLPVTADGLPAAAMAAAPAQAANADGSLAGVQILVVDDDRDTLSFLTCLLQSEGAQVTATASAHEAIALLQSAAPAVLLCDISMPDMDGYTLMQQIRARPQRELAQMPAIALTANARLADQQMALAAGFQRHLPKPIEPATLLQTIAHLAAH